MFSNIKQILGWRPRVCKSFFWIQEHFFFILSQNIIIYHFDFLSQQFFFLGLDKDLDRVAVTKLGLLKPQAPISYGVMSKGGVMSLMMPTWQNRARESDKNQNTLKKEDFFTALGNWLLKFRYSEKATKIVPSSTIYLKLPNSVKL